MFYSINFSFMITLQQKFQDFSSGSSNNMLRNSFYLFYSLQVLCIILKAYFRGVQVPSPLSNSLCLYKPLAPPGTSGKEPTCQCWLGVKDGGSIPGWGRSPGEGNGNPLQYSYLENPMDRGSWWATVHRVAQSQT